MLPGQIGFISLVFSLFISLILFFFIFQDYKSESQAPSLKVYSLSFLQLLTIIISFFCLVLSFVISDFSLAAVYQNSHTTKPLLYKISGTWGNHEGSLLLWLLVLSIFSFCFLVQSKYTPKKYRLLTVLFQNIITIGFLLFVIKTSNPFLNLFPVPNEGLGLNPILQDPALAIHPPILYLGYVGSSIIFSSALSAMIHRFVNPSWADSIKIWILTPWIFLTLGIMLGSIWAYYELGWGGFWFWDPVENVSLMPWFSLTALVHSIIILKKRDTFHSWVLILAIITFTLSMNGTFLVRSGILNSVHTFANDPERGFYILTFLFLLILLSLIIFFIYQPKDNSVKSFFLFSRETAISVNNWFMMFFLSAVLIGTIYPLILEITKDIKISVGAPFFNIIIIPFLVPFLFFMIFGPKLKWIKTNENLMSKKLIFNFFLSLVFSSIIYFFWGKATLLNSIIFLLGLFLLLTLLFEFLETITKKNKVNIPRIISHFGFGLLIVSISLNTIFSIEMDINLKIGESYKFKKYELKFNSISGKVEKNFNSLLGSFSLTDPKGDISYLKPEIRIYNQPNITTSEANIKTNFFYDRFITMSNIQNSEFFNIRFQQKFMMIWIWISALLISLGGILSVFRQKD